MQKLIVVIMVAILAGTGATLSAQPNVGHDVNYYGVDFSKAKAFGAAETGAQFVDAFNRINSLVIAEWSKYDPGKFFGKNIVSMDISPTARVNYDIDLAEVITTSSAYFISRDEVAEMVRRYELKQTEGTGVVIIGELLNKSTYMGTFVVVFFDIASRDVLYGQGMMGKARGFGLRNYWAGALLDAMKGIDSNSWEVQSLK